MSYLINLVISGIAVAIAAYLVPGASVNGLPTAIIVAVVLGLVNGTIGRILKTLAIPVNFVTFGLVSALINLFVLFLTDRLIGGFSLGGWVSALLFSIVLGFISSVLGANPKK